MKTIPVEQKVVQLRLPSYESSSDEGNGNIQFDKVVEITMQIKKIPKLKPEQRVKDAKKQAMKTIVKKGRQSEVVESSPRQDHPNLHLDVDMAPIADIRKAPLSKIQKGEREAAAKAAGIKRPVGAYIFYNKEQFPLRDKSLTHGEATKKLGATW